MARLSVVSGATRSGFAQAIDEYVVSRQAGGASPKTIRIYRDALEGVLLPFASDREITEVAKVTSHLLNELNVGLLDGTASRSGRPLSPATVSSYMRAVNTWLKWVRDEKIADVDARAKLPRKRREVLDVLTAAEVDRMENAAIAERDRLIVRTLWETGVRLGELLALTTADLQTTDRRSVVKVGGKTGQRLVAITPALARRLQRYASGQRLAPDDRIFTSLKRRPLSGQREPLTESGVQQMIRLLAERAGVTKRVYAHLFRHSMATEWLRRGESPIVVMNQLGHTSLAMISEVYQHLTTSDQQSSLMRVIAAQDKERARR